MQLNLKFQRGFTLIEIIVVMVITSVLGGVVILLTRGPMQGYVDSARRAGMSDIADIAISRITRDLRTALPNSVRITLVGSVYYLEFIPTTGGGRYRSNATGGTSSCGGAGDDLSIGVADTCFEVLGPMPTFAAGNLVVVDNTATTLVYNASNSAPWVSNTTTAVTITSLAAGFPSASPGNRFQVISTPVTYVCSPVAGGVGGTLTRYWGYAIQAAQPSSVATLTGLPGVQSALLATNVSTCSFSLPAGNSLVSMQMSLTESGESVSLYDTANVANLP